MIDPGRSVPRLRHRPNATSVGTSDQGIVNGRRAARVLFVLVAAAICVLLPWLSVDYGVTWDEPARHANGVDVIKYWSGTLGEAGLPRNESQLYGGMFDVIAYGIHGLAGGDLWITRHRVNAAVGALGIVATGALAWRLMNPAWGVVAMVLLVLSPRYVGHAMNNPKDIPFATFCMLALLSFFLLRREPPFLSWPRAILIGLALALPLNVRPGGVLYLGYLGAALLILAVRARLWRPGPLAEVVARGLVASVVMLVAGCVFWPWALQNPLVRPFEALLGVVDFGWHGQTLFMGESVPGMDVRWYYLPTWIGITTPPVVLVGILVSPFAGLSEMRQGRVWPIALGAVVLLPLALVIVNGSTLYDGWRHLLFVYPPLVILAVSGWRFVWLRAGTTSVRGLVAAVFVAAAIEPIAFSVRNHPNEVVYFNRLVKGPRGATGKFDLDYWGNSLLQATAWSAALAKRAGVPLLISGEPYGAVRGDALRFESVYPSPPEVGIHHIQFLLARGSAPELEALARRTDVLHVIRMADGAPLVYVVPGPRLSDVWVPVESARSAIGWTP